jgi:hypothetical protein
MKISRQFSTKSSTISLETPYTWEVELSVLGQTKFADDAERKQLSKINGKN